MRGEARRKHWQRQDEWEIEKEKLVIVAGISIFGDRGGTEDVPDWLVAEAGVLISVTSDSLGEWDNHRWHSHSTRGHKTPVNKTESGKKLNMETSPLTILVRCSELKYIFIWFGLLKMYQLFFESPLIDILQWRKSLVSFPRTESGCCVGERAWPANTGPKIGWDY